MNSLFKNPKPHYEGKNKIIKRSENIDTKKIIPELVRIIKKSKKIEEEFKFRMKDSHEALL
ncbi:hypothetical protein HYS03_01175 [Candidatus Woesebacteria bacterium]|nr:hypothetical protein [Candidatus Woesebacteria bacterium]QQG47777.1 MAG: hypothetical protein HY044_01665 [Candidatus Woesebacteria bacterium]